MDNATYNFYLENFKTINPKENVVQAILRDYINKHMVKVGLGYYSNGSNPILRKALDEFCEEFGIKYNTNVIDNSVQNSSEFLVQLKYDQRNCTFDDSTLAGNIARNCRGLILDLKKNCLIVALPYAKFFNYNEPNAAQIDYSSAKVLEKLDGTMMILYYYNNLWRVATLGSVEASGNVCSPQNADFVRRNLTHLTFKELFWQIWKNSNFPALSEFNTKIVKSVSITNFTFMFEMLSELNEVVVKHEEESLVLHGVRNHVNGIEYDPAEFMEDCGITNIPVVGSFEIFGEDILGETLKEANKHKANELEGFVIVDKNFNRIKIKSDEYIRQHKLRSQFSLPMLVELIQNNEGEELINYLPEYYEIFVNYSDKYNGLIQFIQDLYEHYRSTVYNINRDEKVNKKDFALSIKDIPVSHFLFSTYDAENMYYEASLKEGNKRKDIAKFNSLNYIKDLVSNYDSKSLLDHLEKIDEYIKKFGWVLLVD